MSLWPEDYVEVSALFSWFPLHFRGCQVVTCWHFGEISYIRIIGISPAPIRPSPNNLLLAIGHDEREHIIIHFDGSPNFYMPINMNIELVSIISYIPRIFAAITSCSDGEIYEKILQIHTTNTHHKKTTAYQRCHILNLELQLTQGVRVLSECAARRNNAQRGLHKGVENSDGEGVVHFRKSLTQTRLDSERSRLCRGLHNS